MAVIRRGLSCCPLTPCMPACLCVQRLYGNGTGITCVGFNKMEVIAGTLDGHVLVWWINTGDIMRDIKVSKHHSSTPTHPPARPRLAASCRRHAALP